MPEQETSEARGRHPAIPDALTQLVRETSHRGCECGMLRRRAPFGVAVAHTRNHLNQLQHGGK